MAVRSRIMTVDDVPQVARLYADRLLPKAQADADPTLVQRRLVQAYFEHPWPSDDIASIVCEDDGGRIIGFLGVTPRPMVWRGEALRAAIIGNLVVAQDKAAAGASHSIISQFVAGPQDLAISDFALDVTRRISDRYGGATIRLLSQFWSLDLSPATLAAQSRVAQRLGPAQSLLRPMARAIDAADRRVRRGPWWMEPAQSSVHPLSMQRMAQLIDEHGGDSIKPVYTAETLERLLAPPRGLEGRIVAREVKNPDGHTLGSFVFYLDGDAELVHMGAALGAGDRVFRAAVQHATERGAGAMTGRILPPLMRDMSRAGARFYTDSWLILHTRRPDIVAAFHAGDVFFNALDGEVWSMRFVAVDDQD